MPLKKEQIIEIQAAAKFNTLKRIREGNEEKEYKEQLAEEIALAKAPKSLRQSVAAEADEPESDSETISKKGK